MEWIVMNLIWDSVTLEASEAIDRLASAHQWSPSTIKSMLHRLVRKGALTTEANGRKYVYRAAVRAERMCAGRQAVPFWREFVEGMLRLRSCISSKWRNLRPRMRPRFARYWTKKISNLEGDE